MITFLALVVAVYVLGSVLLYVGMKNAPEMNEDATEFLFVWCNNDPAIPDVACVWDAGSTQPAM